MTEDVSHFYIMITILVIVIREDIVEIVYSNARVEAVCNDIKTAQKFFGGDRSLVTSLFGRIQTLRSVPTLADIISAGNNMRFHNLHNQGARRLEGYYAIDVKTVKQPWRIIIQPLDDNKESFPECRIDTIAKCVRIIEIEEISKHYE